MAILAFSRYGGLTRPALEQADDAWLLSHIARGDHEAFSTLVRRHSLRFYRTAYRFCPQKSEAEDIVQDAFLKLWERPYLWQEARNTAFTTWFYRVVVNLCLDHAKKKRPGELIEQDWVEDETPSQEDALIEREKQRLLDSAIASLPERQRTALTLCFREGLSNQEAADIMNLHLKALQALIMRAKTTLRDTLGLTKETRQ